MSQFAIEVQNVSKRYELGLIGSSSLRETLSLWGKNLFKRQAPKPNKSFWALRDLSFEVKQGEVLGIIGHNGAGKSTLLKLLSRITRPSNGQIRLHGRVASLLEVGTGFHPELTGRENIFLNGSILGMSYREIRAKFDEIVHFSDIETFIDTPVKRYSSGMYVRLAFSVAAHLEPEILIVDEVLAVGDIAFQKKCLGKMEDVSSSGRTVLFVSHNMEAVQTLTKQALLLHQGQMEAFGPTDQVLKRYLDLGGDQNLSYENTEIQTEREIEFLKAKILSHNKQTGLILDIEFIVRKDCRATIGLELANLENIIIWNIRDLDHNQDFYQRKTGKYRCQVRIPLDALAPNVYGLTLSLAEQGLRRYHYLKNVLRFEIIESPFQQANSRQGILHLPSTWEIQSSI